MNNENNSLEPENAVAEVAAEQPEEKEDVLYSWSGQERTWLLSGASWYFYGAIIATILLLYALLTQAWTLAILTSLLAGTIYLYSQEQAPTMEAVISTKGIYVGDDFYAYHLIKSCWFSFETGGAYLVISLLNMPQARVSFSFKPEDKTVLHTLLKDHTVIDDYHQDTWLERIEKLL